MRYRVPDLDHTSSRRHLIYELVLGHDWRGPLDLLTERLDLFDGERLIAISCDQSTDMLDDLRALLASRNCEVVHIDSEPVTGRSPRFWSLLRELCRSVDENDLIWHGEVTHAMCEGDRPPDYEIVHRLCLSDLDAIQSSLTQKLISGPFLAQCDLNNSASWHFQGSCYWFRAAALYHRFHDYSEIGGLNSATWPCATFDRSEVAFLSETDIRSVTGVLPPANQRALTVSAKPALKCDIIITCHNYCHFLAECLSSVKRQPSELIGDILVVDDASTDATASITTSLGTKYLRVDVHDPHLARAAGFQRTNSPFVLFLDADNLLAEGYLRCALDRFALDPQLGVVYMDLQYFGDSTDRISMPRKFNASKLSLSNYMDTGCVARREAIDQASPFRRSPCQRDGLEDWYLWRRLFESGNWRAEWQPVPLLYRRHGNQRLENRRKGMRATRNKYFVDAAMNLETITVFTTVSHRVRQNPMLWKRRLEWIERQTWPREQLRICIANTSHQPVSVHDLSLDRLAGLAGITVYDHPVGGSGLEDVDRRQEEIEKQVQTVVAAIYNRMLREVPTQWCLILEDDVFPEESDLIERLLSSSDANTIAVAAAYKQRYCNSWSTWDTPSQLHRESGEGVAEIGGSGFGCLLLRLSQCRDELFQGNTAISRYYDVDFFVRARQKGLRAKVDWSVVCDHVDTSS